MLRGLFEPYQINLCYAIEHAGSLEGGSLYCFMSSKSFNYGLYCLSLIKRIKESPVTCRYPHVYEVLCQRWIHCSRWVEKDWGHHLHRVAGPHRLWCLGQHLVMECVKWLQIIVDNLVKVNCAHVVEKAVVVLLIIITCTNIGSLNGNVVFITSFFSLK